MNFSLKYIAKDRNTTRIRKIIHFFMFLNTLIQIYCNNKNRSLL